MIDVTKLLAELPAHSVALRDWEKRASKALTSFSKLMIPGRDFGSHLDAFSTFIEGMRQAHKRKRGRT